MKNQNISPIEKKILTELRHNAINMHYLKDRRKELVNKLIKLREGEQCER